jgi:L-alanine-DL-glutamate epimerase-like enolase superfamily enzyme
MRGGTGYGTDRNTGKLEDLSMTETYTRPVAMHDCTCPFTRYAGIHLAINAPNALYQESVRAYLRVTYPEMVTMLPSLENAHILAPAGPGLGTALLPELRTRADATLWVSSSD